VKGIPKRTASERLRHPTHRHAPARWLPHVPAVCLAVGTVSLNTGLFLALCASEDIQTFFYQPRVLAVMHSLTLGWISLAVTGVLYRYVPTLTKQPLRWPWLGRVQVGAFIAGVMGMVAHFWIGRLNGMAWSAGVVFLSIILLVVLLLPLLLRAPQYDATVIGIGTALFSFFGVAGLGLMDAIDKARPFIGGDVFSNIAAHAHLAVLGWVGLTICAVSYRMIAAFALPEVLFPRPARLQVLSLAVIVPLLVAALLARSTLDMPLAVAAAASVLWYVVIVLRLLRTRRMPLDWSIRHVQAAMVHLCIAVVCGLAFAFEVDVRRRARYPPGGRLRRPRAPRVGFQLHHRSRQPAGAGPVGGARGGNASDALSADSGSDVLGFQPRRRRHRAGRVRQLPRPSPRRYGVDPRRHAAVRSRDHRPRRRDAEFRSHHDSPGPRSVNWHSADGSHRSAICPQPAAVLEPLASLR
jgi:hypothetical protein